MSDELEMQDQSPEGGLDRRSLLRRSALLGGAIVWTTPVVQSLATPAFAGTPKPPTCACKVRFQWSPGHIGFTNEPDVASAPGSACCVADNYASTTLTVGAGGVIPGCTAGAPSPGAVTITYPLNGDKTMALIGVPLACSLEDGDARGGNCVAGVTDCGDSVETGTTTNQRLYTVKLSSKRIAHITGVICC